MAKRAIIRMGDPTSHGGTVLEGFSTLNVYGKNASGIGHIGYCPLCKTPFQIVSGAENYTFCGKNVAVEGMYTSCGATLIATQHEATVGDTPSGQAVLSPTHMYMTPNTASGSDLEYYFVVEREDGSPVSLAYRIDADGEKLYEGRLSSDGATAAFPMSQAGEPTFWMPQV